MKLKDRVQKRDFHVHGAFRAAEVKNLSRPGVVGDLGVQQALSRENKNETKASTFRNAFHFENCASVILSLQILTCQVIR